MSTITAVLEADADGTLHVPLPTKLRQGKIRITATMTSAEPDAPAAAEERSVRISRAKDALRWLQAQGTFRGVDAVAWQREIRADRPLSGRDE